MTYQIEKDLAAGLENILATDEIIKRLILIREGLPCGITMVCDVATAFDDAEKRLDDLIKDLDPQPQKSDVKAWFLAHGFNDDESEMAANTILSYDARGLSFHNKISWLVEKIKGIPKEKESELNIRVLKALGASRQ
ncbi:hypothetical protein FACS1894186_5910 [Alphaproteobacteria bacterium]|nr:hypothetical protein FACS1894186_5910 [Alphaproteobacteria bacterium]